MRFAPILLLFLLAGCAGNRDGKWPTLAPRPGENSPMVPRTPLGACAGCGQDVFAAPAEPPPVVLPPVPADAGARLTAIEKGIAAVEADYPAQRRATETALRAASGAAADSNVATEAEVQRSRLESLFLPLATQARALDALEDDVTGKADAATIEAGIAAARARLARLEGERIALIGY